MKVRKCTICGKEFMSYNGMEVCSESCRIERKRRQDYEGNLRRRQGISGQNKKLVCPVCGKEFLGLREKYCCRECSMRAREAQVKKNNKFYYVQAKNACKNNKREI